MSVRLSETVWGSGAARLVVLHGLLGSARNWATVGKSLAERVGGSVIGLDLRNHGASGGGVATSIDELVDDVELTLTELALGSVAVLGHSLGGKVAMRMACRAPSRVSRLVVVDIAPRAYETTDDHVDALRALPVASLRSRKAADAALAGALAGSVVDRAHRQFLLTNLVRSADGEGFAWRVDLDALAASLGPLRGDPLLAGDAYAGPVLWVVGGRSRYVVEGDEALMRARFADLRVARFATAGHNVHVDARSELVDLLAAWV